MRASMWDSYFILIFVASCCANKVLAEEDDSFPVVTTSYGPVQGLKGRSPWTNKTIYSFRGIPYASPPVGNLRFKDSIPPLKWNSVRNCTVDGLSCHQPKKPFFVWSDVGEDCLFLNVYSPQIKSESVLLPVMVWVHGGGFLTGSGDYKQHGPDMLVGQGVVVVTLNYRLGALGFMTLGTREAPGNAGMKDQRLALKWVQSEIHQFGGDPREVTLFGESAGSASVHLQYLSPISNGLFHRAIAQSGTSLNWAVREDGPQYGMKLAELLNCSTHNTQTALKCMLEADAEEIVSAQEKVMVSPESFSAVFNLVFLPSVDADTSDEPFLPAPPVQLIHQKQGSLVPIILGINSDEGMMPASIESDGGERNVTVNLVDMIPIKVKRGSTEERLKLLKERLQQFYFKDFPPSTQNITGYINMYTDVSFGYDTAVSAKYFRNRDSVYVYRFSYEGDFKLRWAKHFEEKFNITGVDHAEELGYIFVSKSLNQTAPEDSADMKTWRRMVKLWTNFAKYGKPTVGKDPELQNVTWLPVKETSTRYLEIGSDLTMVNSDLLAPNVAFWDTITPSTSTSLRPAFTIMVASSGLLVAKQMFGR